MPCVFRAAKDKRVLSSLLFILIIIIDQLSKVFFATSCNSGIAFGIFESFKTFNLIFVTILVISCTYFLFRQKKLILVISLVMVIAGGTSNLIDRVIFGCVRDFIQIWVWPSFNLADSAITTGAIFFMLMTIFKGSIKFKDLI